MNNIITKIDFRSDTVTQPTQAMRNAMMEAKVGDDVYEEDETVQSLENKISSMFQMEAGLFCPSGTMTNQIAIKSFTQPMDEVICDQSSHVYRYEGGGIAYHSMSSVRLLYGVRGILTTELIEPEINEDNIHYPNSSLVVLENTVNKGGGACYTLEDIGPIASLCKEKGIKLHLDGARLFNALVATGDQAKDYGQYFDGISICLSKGLGAPVGSVLLGSKETIARSKKIRKAFGGGMRQAGFLAAAGIYALENNVQRLADDHRHAAVLEQTLLTLDYVHSVMPVQTNIVIFKLKSPFKASNLVDVLNDQGILCNTTGADTVRFVTHLDVTSAMIDQAIEILKQVKLS